MDEPAVCANPSRANYVAGCRCPGCTEENTVYQREQREKQRERAKREAEWSPGAKGSAEVTRLPQVVFQDDDLANLSTSHLKQWYTARADKQGHWKKARVYDFPVDFKGRMSQLVHSDYTRYKNEPEAIRDFCHIGLIIREAQLEGKLTPETLTVLERAKIQHRLRAAQEKRELYRELDEGLQEAVRDQNTETIRELIEHIEYLIEKETDPGVLGKYHGLLKQYESHVR